MNRYTFPIILLTISTLPLVSSAYMPNTTHAGLTQELVEFYIDETHNDISLDLEDIVNGAMSEDDPESRALNHFYDPIRNMGFNNGRTSKEWALGDLVENNYSWGKGIEAYARGDRQLAMETLGHVLHLIEDATVPDHTRNDPHKGDGVTGLYTNESPFETWASLHKNRETLRGLSRSYWNSGERMNGECSAIAKCFDVTALYSNKHFFSRDTIEKKISDYNYAEPDLDSLNYDGKYGYEFDNKTRAQNKVVIAIYNSKVGKTFYFMDTPDDHSVMSDYFDRLGKAAILNGAQVVDSFIKEGEVARKKYLLDEAVQRQAAIDAETAYATKRNSLGFFARAGFDLKNGFVALIVAPVSSALASFGGTTGVGARLAYQSTTNYSSMATYSIVRGGVVGGADLAVATQQTSARITKTVGNYEVAQAKKGQALATKGVTASVGRAQVAIDKYLLLIAQIESARSSLLALASGENKVGMMSLGEVLGTSSAPTILPVQVPSSRGGGLIAYNSPQTHDPIIVLGVAQGSAPIPPIVSRTPEVEDVPSVGNKHGDETATTTASTTVVDITPPSRPTVVVPATGTTTVATTTVYISGIAEQNSIVTLIWHEGLDTYGLIFATDEIGNFAYTIVLPEGETSLTLIAEDVAGNRSDAAMLDIRVKLPSSAHPPILRRAPQRGEIIFNEIAWGGTLADPHDEWIELYNTTTHELILSSTTLRTEDGGLSLPLSGTLAPHGYLLLTRSRDDALHALSGVLNLEELPWGEGLDDAGEHLLLETVSSTDASAPLTVIDELPYCLNWCGKGEVGASMERWRTDMPTALYAGNWKLGLNEFAIGIDTNGDSVSGTPGSRNSLNYLLSLGNVVGGDLLLANLPGGYLINGNTLTLPAGSTLVISPGVIIKSKSYAPSLLTIRGLLLAEGTKEEPVIFTTTSDDRFGGDIFQDGNYGEGLKASRSGGLDFYNTSAGSVLSSVQLYNLRTGPYFDRTMATMTSVSIIDSSGGLELFKSTVLASDLLVRNISDNDAVQVYGGSHLTVSSSTVLGVLRGDGFDIYRSTLIAEDIKIYGVGDAKALNLYQSTSTIDRLLVGDTHGSTEVYVAGGKATITDATLIKGDRNGVYASQGATLTLASTTISDFPHEALFVDSGALVNLVDSIISGSGIGVYTLNATVVNINSQVTGNTIDIVTLP